MNTRGRLNDFEERSRESLVIEFGESFYIPIHDEGQWKLDAYWKVENDVYFVEAVSLFHTDYRDKGIYGRKSNYGITLHGVLDAPTITARAFENTLSQFRARMSLINKIVSDKLVPIDETHET